jgi:glycosyltransferase involved in cell wall biosynthesis
MTAPRITLCICTYNRYDRLPSALDSALKQRLDRSLYRIVVVDNSPDHQAAEAFGAPYRDGDFLTYLIERTPGLSNARNVGARECGTEFIAFMDDDAIAYPQWLEQILEGFDRFGPQTAAVGGKVSPIWEAPRPSWLGDTMLGLVSVVDWGGEMRIAGPNEWLAGTNIAFRTQTILDAGGFDLNLGRKGGGASLLSNEEIMIVNHLREKGLVAVYAPEAHVQHLVERRRLQRSWFRKRMAWQAVSDYMSEPKAAVAMALGGWEWAMGYFFELPPRERTIRGLYHDVESPALMRRQLDALYTFTLMQLAGFEGVPEQDRAALGRL